MAGVGIRLPVPPFRPLKSDGNHAFGRQRGVIVDFAAMDPTSALVGVGLLLLALVMNGVPTELRDIYWLLDSSIATRPGR